MFDPSSAVAKVYLSVKDVGEDTVLFDNVALTAVRGAADAAVAQSDVATARAAIIGDDLCTGQLGWGWRRWTRWP